MSGRCGSCIHFDCTISAWPFHGKDSDHYCTYYGSYHDPEDVCNSFVSNESDSSCYLTSACVGYLGKPDDCYELTTLRTFRDGYLKKTDEGDALVKQYYEVAPKIVEKIEASGKQQEYYEYIYGVVKECVTCIENGDQEGALSRYRAMTLKLQTELL